MTALGQEPVAFWLPEGMDPQSSFLLEIRLTGNSKKRRKEFSCFSFSKVVDSDLCNFKDLVEEIVDQYPHGYQEIVHVFYYDDAQKCFPKVTSDQELLEMFRKHIDSKVVHMTIAYTDPGDAVPISEFNTPENAVLLDIPCTPSLACPSIAAPSQSTQPTSSLPTEPTTNQSPEPSTDQPIEDEHLKNPEPQERKGHTSVEFVRNMAIVGTSVRRVTRRT